MIRFVANREDGMPVKRKQTPKACEKCRKRKKRCHHESESFNGDKASSVPSQLLDDVSIIPPETQQLALEDPLRGMEKGSEVQSTFHDPGVLQVQPMGHGSRGDPEYFTPTMRETREQSELPSNPNDYPPGGDEALEDSDSERDGEQSRYLGHTNPETMFLEVASPADRAPTTGSDTVGVWLPRKTYEQVQKGSAYAKRQRPIHFSQDPFVTKVLLPYLTDQSMRLVPDCESFNALRLIYERDIHPIFPILAFETMPQWNGISELSPTRVLLMQSLCLAVAVTPAAQSYLLLPSTGPSLLTPKDFAASLSRAMLTSLDLVGNHGRMVSIRALSVLSLFSQLSDDDHSSAEYCARAVSYVQTLQIHLSTSKFRKDHRAVTTVYLCVWALDRFNAAFHGRPVLFHSRDSGRDMKATIAEQKAPFRLLLSVVQLLDNIIDLYRPVVDSSVVPTSGSLPAFEDMVVTSGAAKSNAHLTATIETLYHAVAMLSCRFDSLEAPDRSSAAYVRQSLSATRLVALVGTEFEENLSIFPFVPYSISLCLRVYYRDLRISKASIHWLRAKDQLQTSCRLLSRYRDTFAFAERMVSLAERTISELEKVTTTMAQTRSARQPIINGTNDINGSAEPAGNSLEAPQTQPFPQQAGSYYDFNLDGSIDMNIFDYFDPGFDLDAIDAALAQNISADALPDFDFASDFGFTPVDARLEDTIASTL